MEELAKALNEYDGADESLNNLNEAANKWAFFVLKAHNGKLRKRGMDITFAICDYIDALQLAKGGEDEHI